MADFWAHIYYGQQLKKSFSDITSKGHIFSLGCQGPDVFFYEAFAVHTNPKNLGELIHEDQVQLVFKTAFEYLKKNDTEDLRNYIYGWVLHYFIDKNVHPYIDSKRLWVHKRLEANIDTYIINKYEDQRIHALDSSEILTLREGHFDVFKMYQFIGEKIFDKKIDFDVIKKSIKNFRMFHKVFNQKYKVFEYIIRGIGKLLKRDLKIYFYHDINRVELPKDIHEVDALFEKGLSEGLSTNKLLKDYLENKVSIEDIMKNFEAIDYSGMPIKKQENL